MENRDINDGNIENNEPNFSRRKRSSDSRETDTRSAQSRPPIVFGNNSKFNLPQSMLADKRYEFSFTPYIVGNTETYEGFEKSQEKGWEAVEASQYPEARRVYKSDPFRRRESQDEFIKIGGQICQRRTVDLKEAEEEYYNEENYHRDQIVDLHRDNNPGGVRILSHSRTKGRPQINRNTY